MDAVRTVLLHRGGDVSFVGSIVHVCAILFVYDIPSKHNVWLKYYLQLLAVDRKERACLAASIQGYSLTARPATLWGTFAHKVVAELVFQHSHLASATAETGTCKPQA